MNLKFATRIFSLALIVLIPLHIDAQGYIDTLSDEIKNPFQERYALITSKVRTSDPDDWSGTYTRYIGESWSEFLIWTQDDGFAAFRDTCSSEPRAWVNFGSVKLYNGQLTLTSEQTDVGEYLLSLKSDLTPVKWGHQRWLIPTDELELFAYAVNSGSWEDYGSFYRKFGGPDQDPTGLPEIPSQFKHILKRKPVKAKALEIDKKPENWYSDVTIDAGKDKGVIVGMSFWLSDVNDTAIKISVVEVNEKDAVARVVQVTHSYAYDDEGNLKNAGIEDFQLKPGMMFTSRFSN